ncbi:MAG: hypothetical protein ABH846_00330 [Patescibacteria group bacterium]
MKIVYTNIALFGGKMPVEYYPVWENLGIWLIRISSWTMAVLAITLGFYELRRRYWPGIKEDLFNKKSD